MSVMFIAAAQVSVLGCVRVQHDDQKKKALVARSSSEVALSGDAKLAAALQAMWGQLESAESQRGYKDDWRRYCAWCAKEGIDPRFADVGAVQRYVNHLRDAGRAKSTRARALSVLREVYRALVIGGVCAGNPAREVKNPKVDTAPRTPWLEEDRVRALFEHAPEESWLDRRNQVILLCLFLLGWRRAEIARIEVEHFSGTTVRHRVKRDKEAIVGVPKYLLKQIDAWRKYAYITAGPIFPRSPTDDRSVSGKIVYDVVKAAAARAGLGQLTPHALRRTYVTLLSRRGVDMRDIQLAVSHESVTTTERYQKADRAAQQAPGEQLSDLVRRKE